MLETLKTGMHISFRYHGGRPWIAVRRLWTRCVLLPAASAADRGVVNSHDGDDNQWIAGNGFDFNFNAFRFRVRTLDFVDFDILPNQKQSALNQWRHILLADTAKAVYTFWRACYGNHHDGNKQQPYFEINEISPNLTDSARLRHRPRWWSSLRPSCPRPQRSASPQFLPERG